ncbi:MAG: EAL domain-containing protein [Reyranellaceae bacterium]
MSTWSLPERTLALAVAVVVALVAVAAPVLASLYLARQQSIAEQQAHMAQLARDVLRRSDQTRTQLIEAFEQMKDVDPATPCSPGRIRLMGRLALVSDQLQGLAYVDGDRLLCSSFGVFDPPVPVGAPHYRAAYGGEVRIGVELPAIPGTGFILVSRIGTGSTGIVHPRLLLDVLTEEGDIAVGLIGRSARRPIALRGTFDQAWLTALGDRSAIDLFDGDHVVAVRRSNIGDYVAFAAVPAVSIEAGLRRTAAVLVPIGAVAGAVLAFAVFYVARLQLGVPALLKAALRRGEIFVEYQPVVDLRTGAWVGAEALVRWQRRNGETMRPDLFIPVAEESGLIGRVTEAVADIVGREAAGLFARQPGFHLALNLSSIDLASDRVLDLLQRLAVRTGARAGNLVVEITERGLVRGPAVGSRLEALRRSGILIAIDDFGTGYSSLSYLKTLEVDLLKIDKSFVDTIGRDAVTSHVVSQIIEMAKGLKLGLIAEGIEQEQQLRFLRERGVDFGQGWRFARPMAFDALLAGLEAQAAAGPGGTPATRSGARPASA